MAIALWPAATSRSAAFANRRFIDIDQRDGSARLGKCFAPWRGPCQSRRR